MNKKIGILTWYFGINYGARAHSMALRECVKTMGYDCEFINYPSCNNRGIELHTCCMTGNLKRHPIILIKGVYKWFKFKKQLSVYPQSKRVTSPEEIEALGYDTVIIGSDEILNLNHDLASKVYYGVGFHDGFPMVMYAASAGTVPPDTILDKDIQTGLKNMTALSVRDNTTQELLQNNTGTKVEIVLDPTLLYDFGVGRKRLCKKGYLLIYSFGSLIKEKDRIIQFANTKGLKIICVGRRCDWADKSYSTADLEEWLSLYEHASFVVTDSYHGLIFAIKYHKNFVLVERGDKTNKIDGLRNILKVTRNSLGQNDSIEEYLLNQLDYTTIDAAIKKEKKRSLDYLENALKEAVGR